MKVKLKNRSKFIGLIFIVLFLLLLISRKENVSINEIDMCKIEDFDLIISKGQSVQSKFISLFKLSINDYSHIGIMIMENQNMHVLHSTPDGTKTNGIRYDDLQTFLDLSSVSDFTILRHKDLSYNQQQKLKIELKRYMCSQAPFDYNFDNAEHKKIYCSELVWLILTNSGLCVKNEFNIIKPIYPKDFLKLNGFVTINTIKAK